jgi:tRNA(Arg) A34 adenosine deaminase TadA
MPSLSIIKKAKNACLKSSCEYTLAAVLYKGGAVIRVACNENKTISYRKKYFSHGEPSRHAEMNVIHGIPRDVISKCSLLVVRLDKKGNMKSAKPCIACAYALYDSGIKKVFYSNYSGEIMKLDFSELVNGNYSKEHFCENSR